MRMAKQLAFLMWTVLQQLHQHLAVEDAVRREAVTSFAVLVKNGAKKFVTSSAKRRRANAHAPSPNRGTAAALATAVA